MIDTATDTVTTVRAAGRRLTKRVYVDGIEDYDLAKHVDLIARRVDDLDDLGLLLADLQTRSDTAVVRGGIMDVTRTRHVRRLLHGDAQTGEKATLIEKARRWIALDFDSVERPRDVDIADLEACGECAVDLLPRVFRDAAGVVQATSSHGIKEGIRLRLWYWLDRPATGSELTFWLRGSPVDPAAFRPAQLIYTASPVFAPGVRNPLPWRLAWLTGRPCVHVPPAHELQRPPRPPMPMPAPPMPGTPGSGDYAARVLTHALVQIARAHPGQRNPTLFAAACRLAPLVRMQLLAENIVTEALTAAARKAGVDNDPHRSAEREAKKAIQWALNHLDDADDTSGDWRRKGEMHERQ